jgi:arylsulfatase A-like enzyme/Flp pilus assembly protein TadD
MFLIRQLVCVVWLGASALAAAAAPPNVILITLDTVRADRMGFLGSKRGLTPNLDTLARQSVVFTRAYSQVPLTAPSHATILTGTYPQFNQGTDFQIPLAQELPYAPEILRTYGYHTAAFVGAIILDPTARFAPGFDRGFDTYDAGFRAWHSGEDRYHTTERRGGEVVAHALAWLNQHPRGPFFIWIHLYDPHHPYDPPEPYKSKYASSPYDGEIAYTDSAVGKFLSQLRARGLYDNSVIAVMADHGEALGDHGEDTHGIFLYDETIHVPLVIKLPGAASSGKNPAGKASAKKTSAGRRIENPVELVDVLPTILQAVKIPVPPEVQGESLLGMLMPKPAPAESAEAIAATSPGRPAYAETDYPHRAYGWSSLRALRTGKYLYIKAPRQELYDQSADPKAEHDLSSASTAVTGTLAAQLDAFRQKTSSSREAPTSVVDPEAQEKLAALGYVASSGNVSGSGGKDSGADPKDKIEIVSLTNQANFLVEDQRYQEAVPVLQRLIAREPEASRPYVQLGQCLILLKDFPKAVPALRKIVVSRPDLTISHFQLGMALLASEDIAGAVPELEIAVARDPRWERARLMLATAYLQTDRVPDAVKQCEKVLEFDPNHYPTNLLLGRILLLSGDAEAALPKLTKAAELQPEAPEPHLLLTDAYERLGRKTDAAQERAEAKRLGASEEE